MDKKKLYFWVALFLVSQIVLLWGVLSGKNTVTQLTSFNHGYPAHFISLFITAFFLDMTLASFSIKKNYSLLICFIYAVALSGTIEVLQRALTDYRVFSKRDLLWGIIGASAYIAISFIIFRLSKPKIPLVPAKKINSRKHLH
ncbi:MAG: hypothetical protein V1859_02110 [archaeon]